MSRLGYSVVRRRGLWRPGTLVLICIVVAGVLAMACGSDSNRTTGTGGETPRQGAKMGQAVRDGKFEFVAQQVKCGVGSVGADPLVENAQGQFCLVTVKVKNIGNEAQTLSDTAQKGFDANGKEYETNSSAGLYANANNEVFFKDINPGNQVTGKLVFDIPKDAKLVKLELHDSPFSGGVAVQLR